MEHQGPGLLACDEELVARVWDRVAAAAPAAEPQCPPTVLPAASAEEAALCPAPETAMVPLSPAPMTQTGTDPTGSALQRWTLLLLTDAAELHAAARRAGRQSRELGELEREKRRQAKSLAAEYFLRTGVRYWPEAAGTLSGLPLFPALRTLYLTQRRRENDLRAQAAREEPELANRYLALADAARAAAHRLRALLESAW